MQRLARAIGGVGGKADRIDFIDDQRSQLWGATYSSCGADGTGTPAWLLSADHIKLDRDLCDGVSQDDYRAALIASFVGFAPARRQQRQLGIERACLFMRRHTGLLKRGDQVAHLNIGFGHAR